MMKALICIASVGALITNSGLAQTPVNQTPVAVQTSDKGWKQQDASFSASQRSIASSAASQLSIEGGKDDTTAKAKVGLQLSNFAIEAKGSVPITKSDDQGDLADLDGLANKATADFGLSWVRWNPTADITRFTEVCEQKLVDEGSAKTRSEAFQLMKKLKDTGEPVYPCTLLAMPQGSKYRDQIRRLIDWGAAPVLISARYKFSNEQFTYSLPAAFVDQKEKHVSYTGTAAIGVVPHKLGLVQLVYNYESSFQGSSSKSLCTPAIGSVSSICRNVATEAPEHTIKNIIQLETRAFIGTSFGLAPIISGDLRSKTAAINLPIYAFKAKDGGLNGGVSLKWKSDNNAFTATVFVGDVLTLLSKN